jgi:hypothetical protein
MAFYPELTVKGLNELLGMFKDIDAIRVAGEKKIYSQELALAILRCGIQGISLLIGLISSANTIQLQAIIFAIGSSQRCDEKFVEILKKCIADSRATIISEAIDALRKLDIKIEFNDIVKFLNHKSPYVRGAVIRYIAAIHTDMSKEILLQALGDPHYIVRENAVDEIESLNIREAIPYLKPLLYDKFKDVRLATEFALSSLDAE